MGRHDPRKVRSRYSANWTKEKARLSRRKYRETHREEAKKRYLLDKQEMLAANKAYEQRPEVKERRRLRERERRRKPEYRERVSLNYLRSHGQYTVPTRIRVQGSKVPGITVAKGLRLGTGDMPKNIANERRARQAYRAFGIVSLYRRARNHKEKRIDLSSLPLSEQVAQRAMNEANIPNRIEPESVVEEEDH